MGTEENTPGQISTVALNYAYRSNSMFDGVIHAKEALDKITDDVARVDWAYAYMEAKVTYERAQRMFNSAVEYAGVLLGQCGCLPPQNMEAA